MHLHHVVKHSGPKHFTHAPAHWGKDKTGKKSLLTAVYRSFHLQSSTGNISKRAVEPLLADGLTGSGGGREWCFRIMWKQIPAVVMLDSQHAPAGTAQTTAGGALKPSVRRAAQHTHIPPKS